MPPSDKDIIGVFGCIDRHDRVPDNYGYCRIHSDELKKCAYRGLYKAVITWLEENEYIEVDYFWQDGVKSIGYRPIKTPDVVSNSPTFNSDPTYSDELCEAVGANLTLFTQEEEWEYTSEKDRRYQEYIARKWELDFRGDVTRKDGARMYSLITRTTGFLRGQLQIDGKPSSVVDISSSQPWVMAILTKDDDLLADVLGGNFYAQFPLGKAPVRRGQRISEKDWQKEAYGRVFLGAKFMTDNPVKKTREHVAAKYPKAWKWSVDLRKNGDSPAATLQKEEARFVLDHVLKRLIDEDKICAPIHDAIMCKASEAEYVQDIFKEEAQSLYGSDIRTHIE